jgi:hypothetical protein
MTWRISPNCRSGSTAAARMKINQTKELVHALIGRFASIERVVTTEYEGLNGQTGILGAYVHGCVCTNE